MTAIAPADLPADGELAAALRPLFANADIDVLGRRPNAYTSSSRSEVVTIHAAQDGHRDFLVKYDRPGGDAAPACRHGIEYCDRVYRGLVSRLPLPHLRSLGLIRFGATGLAALVVEHLDHAFRVGEAPEVSGILSAAEWCGCFHRWGTTRRDDSDLAFLVRYDAGYFRAWADRAARLAAAGGRQTAWLDRTCAAFRDLADVLATAPSTIIHGELSPQNVLWRDGEIYPVDWESAAVAAGEIDLAALLFGWPEEMVDRSVTAYWQARQAPPPPAFAQRFAAATLYTALRWLPPPATDNDPRFSLAVDRLQETATALGVC